MIDTKNFELRQLTKEGLQTLVTWAAAEGWNPGIHDHEVFWETDPEGFYGFYAGETLIAGGAVVSYHQTFGFMGLFIVHPEHRGQGIGRKLWHLRRDLLIRRLNPGAAIGMDGVVAMQPFYEKGGFRIAFRDERYERMGSAFDVSHRITTINVNDHELLMDYDIDCVGYDRKVFLRSWLRTPNSQGFKFMQDNRLCGYAVIRKAIEGYKIGPLFADTSEVAEELYKACLNASIGQPVFLDIPVINKGAVELLRKYEARYVFECARMYLGEAPHSSINKVFGITTFELG
jgi:GNAT superfamily N-acetyltransferase